MEKRDGVERIEIKPQVDEWRFSDGHSVIVLTEGRLLNLGNATGHPSFVMSNSFTNQTIAQIELFTKNDEYEKQVYVLPKHLDEKVARLHLDALGVDLTELSAEQAAYIGDPGRGPVQARPLPLLIWRTGRAHLAPALGLVCWRTRRLALPRTATSQPRQIWDAGWAWVVGLRLRGSALFGVFGVAAEGADQGGGEVERRRRGRGLPGR